MVSKGEGQEDVVTCWRLGPADPVWKRVLHGQVSRHVSAIVQSLGMIRLQTSNPMNS